ncbi:MAG: hypothetical protein KJ710_02195 [Candidatus Omnitrophica bacterium]|nr:hypothetical protein [Candidatus Omnitrophota bacterium]
MAEGVFLVKFNGKEVVRCFAISFDYDAREYTINETETKPLPDRVGVITIEVEQT